MTPHDFANGLRFIRRVDEHSRSRGFFEGAAAMLILLLFLLLVIEVGSPS